MRAVAMAGIGLLLAAGACGGRSVGAPPGAPPGDGGGAGWKDSGLPDGQAKKDGSKKDGPEKDGPGGPCTKLGQLCAAGGRCCSGLQCVATVGGVQLCLPRCTPDDPNTLEQEDTCIQHGPRGTLICGWPDPAVKTTYCLQVCQPMLGSSSCPAGVACNPLSTRMVGSTRKVVCGYRACTSGRDCPVLTAATCKPGASGQCTGLPSKVFCQPHSTGATSGRCALPGACDRPSGLCGKHTWGKSSAGVGDTCTDDRDCAGQMTCLAETRAGTTVQNRNGYCAIRGCAYSSTLKVRACSPGSVCSILYPTGLCLRSCSLSRASDCRGQSTDRHGDYECRAWNRLVLSSTGSRISSTPVCEPGHLVPCTIFGSTSTMRCSHLGDDSNSTSMACRDPRSGKELPHNSPSGFCLDTTASGRSY